MKSTIPTIAVALGAALALACDTPASPPSAVDETGAVASATTSAARPRRPLELPGVHEIEPGVYGLKHHTVIALFASALEGGVQVSKLPVDGYRLDVVPKGSPLEQVGLNGGDEVVSIAGVKLLGARSLMGVFRAIENAPLFELVGSRANRPLKIQYLYSARTTCPPCAADVEPTPPLSAAERQAMMRGIKKVGDTSYEIAPGTLDKILRNQRALLRSDSIAPVKKGTAVMGIELRGLGADSLLVALGFRAGDVVHDINGSAIADPASALEAYSTLRETKTLRVRITREGREMTFQYEIK